MFVIILVALCRIWLIIHVSVHVSVSNVTLFPSACVCILIVDVFYEMKKKIITRLVIVRSLTLDSIHMASIKFGNIINFA